MIKKVIFSFSVIFMVGFFFLPLTAEELPRPSYDNSLILSVSYSLTDSSAEVEYIKSQFSGGLYTWLTYSSFLAIDMNWYYDITNAANGIQSFKNAMNLLIQKAKSYGVGIHVILSLGCSRQVNIYKSAKEEDIRNAQWYNDNNLCTQEQFSGIAAPKDDKNDFFRWDGCPNSSETSPSRYPGRDNTLEETAAAAGVNVYVFTTLSRYARKLRNHLEAKMRAGFDFLKQKQAENPGLLIIVSGPGEAELNPQRPDNPQPVPPLQTFFCDYSPFAILEFRDWIKHEGLYGPGGKYPGEGYGNGGSRYQGSNGLQQFNQDFGTSFTTWNLKYYHWSLSDPVDTNYTDTTNPDPRLIPVGSYTFNGMMPTSGPNFTAGGFDPPRVMVEEGVNPFSDLWQTFRQTLVYHYVKDVAAIARERGLAKERYYTHQFPGDYLWGTRPNDPAIILNERYYSSASPMWTANVYSDIGMGVTIFDLNFVLDNWYARTSHYAVPALSSLSDNCGVMEYNPEIVVPENSPIISPIETLYQQIMRLYDYHIHFVNLFKWEGPANYQYKGTNREVAAKQFFDAVKDKARQPITTVFTPKKVEAFAGQYNNALKTIDLTWSPAIWTGLNYRWEHWGDFKEFVLYRGYTESFQANASSELTRLRAYFYKDTGFANTAAVYYKIAAENVYGEIGSPVTLKVQTTSTGTAVLQVSRGRMNFGATQGGAATPSQSFLISNIGEGVLNWSVSDNADWLTCSPASGSNSGKVAATVNAGGKSPGAYNGVITISAPGAGGSPQTIQVMLQVYSPGNDAAPWGKFETPGDNSTVRSSIPVTGWALDDIAIESVKIYLKNGNQLLYIGDAVFVEGARPDIAAAHPDYPNDTKAGWGYMMLTNFLPNQGNGLYTFDAVARDVTGHEVTLGSKTITCDNANAVKPFGAIDTPTQGGEASGRQFINWGWVLTPIPNKILTDGSTLNVYIDGVNKGHPVYNLYRSDVAALFPGYANRDGAGGYFTLDTTAYSNGIHTIAWTARDNAGNADGIGSRYFSILNAGSGQLASGSQVNDFTVIPGVPDLSRIPTEASGPVRITKGYDNQEFQNLYPGKNGQIIIELKALERLEIHLPGGTNGLDRWSKSPGGHGDEWYGYQVMGDGLDKLPIGSTLDRGKGIFYWQPGPGFAGDFSLVFLTRNQTGKWTKRNLVIKIK